MNPEGPAQTYRPTYTRASHPESEADRLHSATPSTESRWIRYHSFLPGQPSWTLKRVLKRVRHSGLVDKIRQTVWYASLSPTMQTESSSSGSTETKHHRLRERYHLVFLKDHSSGTYCSTSTPTNIPTFDHTVAAICIDGITIFFKVVEATTAGYRIHSNNIGPRW